MIQVHFDTRDLGKTRFAFNPLWETMLSFKVLQDPHALSIYSPWISKSQALLGATDLTPLQLFIRPEALHKEFYYPILDSLLPSSSESHPCFAKQLELLSKVNIDSICVELEQIWWKRDDAPSLVKTFLKQPQTLLDDFVFTLELYHAKVIAPNWVAWQQITEQDVFARGQLLCYVGIADTLNSISLATNFNNNILSLTAPIEVEREAGGLGLIMTPSLFATPSLYITTFVVEQTTLYYPIRGAGNAFIAPREQHQNNLSVLFGSARAKLLSALQQQHTTQMLAATLGITPSAVSHQIRDLRKTGLLESYRLKKNVYYSLSQKGLDLLQAAG
jgi:DNA-binding transcriptional ArsR family regulator